jgi:hypothetical protein
MDKEALNKVLEDLAKEVHALEERKREIETRLVKVRASYANLSNLYEEISMDELGAALINPDPGLTNSIRIVLQNANRPLTPVEVRDELLNIGLSFADNKNPLATIHKVLKRLELKEEIENVPEGEKTTYQWRVTSNERK